MRLRLLRRDIAILRLIRLIHVLLGSQDGTEVAVGTCVAAIGKTWWDSRINLAAGVTFLIALTILYYVLRPRAVQRDS